MIELLHTDCMEYMKNIPDKFFELAIVDPPYGINATKMNMGVNGLRVRDGRSGTAVAEQKKIKGRLNQGSGKLKNRILNTSNCDWDSEKPPQEYFNELFRVSKNQIIWGGNYFNLPETRGVGCWDKLQPWENFSQWEMAWTSFDCPAWKVAISNTGGANNEAKIHPTQKPKRLYKYLLKKFAKEGDKIFDSHLGSGSIAIACHDMKFDLVGCEIDKDYYDAAVKRFNNHKMQGQLW